MEASEVAGRYDDEGKVLENPHIDKAYADRLKEAYGDMSFSAPATHCDKCGKPLGLERYRAEYGDPRRWCPKCYETKTEAKAAWEAVAERLREECKDG